MALPGIGILSYNGFEFGETTETLGVSIRPKYDETGRTVVYNSFNFRFKTHFKNAMGTSAQTLAARRALTKPGGAFIYLGRGFCDLRVNIGTVRDVNYGPRPQEANFEVVGTDKICILTWTIEVCIPDCADAVYQFSPMEFTYEVSYGRLTDGRVTREISGSLTLPATLRDGDRRVAVWADEYRDKVVAVLPENFTRTFGAFKLNSAKNKLRFSYTDTQMPRNMLPLGCIDADANYSEKSSQKGLLKWVCSLSATYSFGREAGQFEYENAIKAFFGIVRDRIDAAIAGNTSNGGKSHAGSFIPLSFDITEPNIYKDRKLQLSMTWSKTSNIQSVVYSPRVWRELKPGTKWKDWSDSLKMTYLSPFGTARLAFTPGDDMLVNLCKFPELSLPNDRPQLTSKQMNLTTQNLMTKTFPAVTEGESYIHYECQLRAEFAPGVAIQQTLPETPLTESSDLMGSNKDFFGMARDAEDPDAFYYGAASIVSQGPSPASNPPTVSTGTTGSTGTTDSGPTKKADNPDDPKAQRRVQSVTYLYVEGSAARVGYAAEVPRLMDVGGVKAVHCSRQDRNEGVISKIAYGANGEPIHVIRFRLRYALEGTPDTMPVMPDPILGEV